MPEQDQVQLPPNESGLLGKLHALANRGTGAMRTSEQWEGWLHRAERFSRLGFTNTMLIWAQNPSAVLLHDYPGWQRLGRQVIGGELGIRLIVTGRDQDERVGAFFDLLQTEGAPVRTPLPRSAVTGGGAATGAAWDTLISLALREGFRVMRADDDTAIDWNGKVIRIRPEDDQVLALTHQVAHVLVHTSQADCHGLRKVEADSLTFLLARRLGLDASGIRFPYVTSWAGTDERAQRARVVAAAGSRILAAASKAFECIDADTSTTGGPVAGPRRAASSQRVAAPAARDASQPAAGTTEWARKLAELARIHKDATRFFVDRVHSSWVPEYLEFRRFGAAIRRDWAVGYAPGSWTELTDHLRGKGYGESAIESAGLAKRSSHGTLFDVFRDRAMFPVRAPDGTIVGFIGRVAGNGAPKYLNSRETDIYRKGGVLFGLHEGREALAAGARPVIVEGPLDAIAVTAAGEGRFAGVAPCGTAFTPEQLGELARACDLSATGVLAAFDADEAGQRAAVHAYTLLADATERPMTVAFSAGEDPASVFTKNGRKALRLVLDNLARPLADVVIDARISRFDRSLEFIEGKFNALASVAPIIADMTPREWPRQAIRVAARLGIAPVEVSDAVIRAMSDARGESPARAGPSRRKASCLAAGDTTELVVSAVLTGTSQGRQERRADVSARPTTSPRQVQRTGRGR